MMGRRRMPPRDDLVHFEDVEVGQTHRFGRYEVTAEEIVEYARQFDPQPFHVDEEAARHSQFGGLIASGWHTGAMLIRMVCDSAIAGHATNGAIGFDDLKWLVPVRPGDVLRSSTWSWRRSSRAAAAISASSRRRAASNQTGEAVMSLTRSSCIGAGPARERAARPEHLARGTLRVNWFVLSFAAALTQAPQFAVVKGRARGIPPLVIVTWTQAIASASWAAFFLVTGHAFALPRFTWPAVAVCAVLVMGMSGLLARASARGDISIVGPSSR